MDIFAVGFLVFATIFLGGTLIIGVGILFRVRRTQRKPIADATAEYGAAWQTTKCGIARTKRRKLEKLTPAEPNNCERC